MHGNVEKCNQISCRKPRREEITVRLRHSLEGNVIIGLKVTAWEVMDRIHHTEIRGTCDHSKETFEFRKCWTFLE
jgi:hypothetical protein